MMRGQAWGREHWCTWVPGACFAQNVKMRVQERHMLDRRQLCDSLSISELKRKLKQGLGGEVGKVCQGQTVQALSVS